MNNIDVVTFSAPTQGGDNEKIIKQVDYLATLPVFKDAFDATNSIILIINSCLQVVFANKAFLNMINVKSISDICGKSAGEMIKCIRAFNGINHCDMLGGCRFCDVVEKVLKRMEKKEEKISEFTDANRLHSYEKNVNLSVHVEPLQIQEDNFYVITFTDKSDWTRKRMLERIFFHDIINTAGALKGIMGLLKEDVPDKIKPELEFVEESFLYLIEEIQTQKYMMDAEDNQLILEITNMETTDILKSVCKLYEGHDLAAKKTITLDHQYIKRNLYTDHRILRRILGNMIKNALEATEQGGIITLGCGVEDDDDEWITFWVHNDQYMDAQIQSLIFHRSFSKKGDGRGLGTYSIKLFGERFLKGNVSFLSSEEEGTWFYIKLPLHLQVDERR